jgi:hypothetical protein
MGEAVPLRTSTALAYAARWAQHGVKLPLRLDETDLGNVTDADGKAVLVVDQWRQLGDDVVREQVLLTIAAVNAFAGLPVEVS